MIETSKEVFCRFQFEALHCWPNAPEKVAYLRNSHRHVFHVECTFDIRHNDRDVEFISKKNEIENRCRDRWHLQDIGHKSCEMLAMEILEAFKDVRGVTVSEDGENGARIWRIS
jgi:hypothetical protein